jgi:tetratricopeptide (TPR) repeat protein
MLGFHEDAQDAYKQAIRINPDFAEALYALGLNYLVLGDRASAIDVYKVLKNLNRDLANELFNVIYR